MFNEEILVKLILLRYILIPSQLRSFDEGYDKDLFRYKQFYTKNIEDSIDQALNFLIKAKNIQQEDEYEDKCKVLINFFSSLPFTSTSELFDLQDYNPFDDFDKIDLEEYFSSKNFNYKFDIKDDEASIFYISDPSKYYEWYNLLENKTLLEILKLFIGFLRELELTIKSPSESKG